jgi:hypothetical protein
MKKITLKNTLLTAMMLFAGFTYGQTDNLVELKSTNNGSEGNAKTDDISNFNIDAAGVITYLQAGTTANDWTIEAATGNATLAGAQSQTFQMKWQVMSQVNTTAGADFGAVVSNAGAGIDRNSAGSLGIRGGASAGIDPNEGYIFGFDANNFDPAVTIQITGISVLELTKNVEKGTIVNRLDTSKQMEVNESGFIDVSGLEVYITGGDAKLNVLSIFNSGDAGTKFKLNGIKFTIRETATLSTKENNEVFATNFSLSQNPVSNLIAINYNSNDVKDFTASLIDLNGRIVQEKKSNTLASKDKITFDATTLSSGLYFVKIQEGTKSAVLKVIKE